MRQYIYIIERCNTKHFWFGTERTFGCVPLLRDYPTCKTTFRWQMGWSQMTGFTGFTFTTRVNTMMCNSIFKQLRL